MLPSDFSVIKKEKSNLNLGKIKVGLLVTFTIIAIALILTQLVFANNLATDGERLAQIEADIERLAAENTTLKVKISEEASLASLSKKAQGAGFTKPSKVIIP